MKTLLITLHSINNPGSALQAFALDRYLHRIGVDNQIIDYRPVYSKLGKNKIKGIIRIIFFAHNEFAINKKYSTFIKEKMHCTTKKFYFFNQLFHGLPKADIYISGSDQLWNTDYDCGCDKAYYLDFIKDGQKISYATSVGKSYISDNQLKELCLRINNYKFLSVRENSTSRLLSQALNREVEWVCDPVFLLDKDDYIQMCNENQYGKYVLVYLSKASILLDQVLEYVKGVYKWSIIQAGGSVKRCECDIHLKNVGPFDFITLIKNAQLIISSSFHATAFSHIFHKNFAVILPEKNGERIISLLELTQLESKIIHSEYDLQNLFFEPNYDEADTKLEAFVNKSKKYLEESILGDRYD